MVYSRFGLFVKELRLNASLKPQPRTLKSFGRGFSMRSFPRSGIERRDGIGMFSGQFVSQPTTLEISGVLFKFFRGYCGLNANSGRFLCSG
jgi:hypothetical protein